MFNKQGEYVTVIEWFKQLFSRKQSVKKTYSQSQNYDLYRKIDKQYKEEEAQGWEEYNSY